MVSFSYTLRACWPNELILVIGLRLDFFDVVDSWTTPAQYQVYLLGQTVNFQVTALHLPHGSLKLFIRNCYATTTSGTSATYNIIDNFGYACEMLK